MLQALIRVASNLTGKMPMSDKTFLDSNVVIYCYTSTELAKQSIATDLANGEDVYVSTQVLQETANILRKKFGKPWPEILSVVDEICQNFHVHQNNELTIREALRIAEKYGFSLYDSLILAAALQIGCRKVYSEDMQHHQVIDSTLEVINPFI